MTRSKEDLLTIIAKKFCMCCIFSTRHEANDQIELVCPTGITIAVLTLFNKGTDAEPFWKIDGIEHSLGGYSWVKLAAL